MPLMGGDLITIKFIQAIVECSLLPTIPVIVVAPWAISFSREASQRRRGGFLTTFLLQAQSLEAMFVQYVRRCSSIDVHAVDVMTRCIYLNGKWLHHYVVRSQSGEGDGASFLASAPLIYLSFLDGLHQVDPICPP
ncbi:hypothetical protein Tco_0351148 [Tanacetum coccineum]